MADPATTFATATVVAVILFVGAVILYSGGVWPLLFFITATAVQSDHDKPAPD